MPSIRRADGGLRDQRPGAAIGSWSQVRPSSTPVAQRVDEDQSRPPTPAFEAEYTPESPLRCPHCKSEISTLQVLRLVRTRVYFISLLPRRGYVVACPHTT